MDVETDHYVVLGLVSGEEGRRLSEQEIKKAYRSKAMELHPDKRRDDPNAHANFQKLQRSYEVLKDEKARKLFDDLLAVKREKLIRQGRLQDSKRRKMMSDLDERERSADHPNMKAAAQEEEERISRKLKEEIARIRKMSSASTSTTLPFKKLDTTTERGGKLDNSMNAGDNGRLNKEKIIKLSNLVGAGFQAFEDSVLEKMKNKVRKLSSVI